MADNRQNPRRSKGTTIPRGVNKTQGYTPSSAQNYSHRNAQQQPAPAAYGYQGQGRGYNGGNIPGNNKKKKGGPWRIVFWLALLVFIASLVALGAIGYTYWKSQDTYKTIGQEAFNPDDLAGKTLADMTIDWDALRAINPDTVGWIYVPNSIINYPIVHTTDNDKYLNTNFNGVSDWTTAAGAIFLSAENRPDFTDSNNVVYGHHMRDGSMFAFFATLQDVPLFNENRTIYILTPQGNYRLETFSIFVCDANDPLGQVQFSSTEEVTEYVQNKMDRTTVNPDPSAAQAADIDKVFTFVTCTGFRDADERTVLFGYPVETTAIIDDEDDTSNVNPDDIDAIDDGVKEM